MIFRIAVIFFFMMSNCCYAQRVTTQGILIKESDGSPTGPLRELTTTNGSLTNNGGGKFALSTSAGNAPSDATYITQIPNATLTAEQALSALASGVLSSTTTTGVVASTAFTAGSIPFGDGAKLTQDNANLFWDDTNNRLGIGTVSPSTSLHTAGGWQIDGTGTNKVRFLTGSASTADRLDIYSQTTNLGIGFQLIPNGTSTVSKLALANTNSNSVFGSAFFGVNGTSAYIAPQTVGGGSAVTDLIFGADVGVGGLAGSNWTSVQFAATALILQTNSYIKLNNTADIRGTESESEYYSLKAYKTNDETWKELIRVTAGSFDNNYPDNTGSLKFYNRADFSEAMNIRLPDSTIAGAASNGEYGAIYFNKDYYGVDKGTIKLHDSGEIRDVIAVQAQASPTIGQAVIFNDQSQVAWGSPYLLIGNQYEIPYAAASGFATSEQSFKWRTDLNRLVLGIVGNPRGLIIQNNSSALSDDAMQRRVLYIGLVNSYNTASSAAYYGIQNESSLGAGLTNVSSYLQYDSQPVLGSNITGALNHFRLIEATGAGTTPSSYMIEVRNATKGSTRNINLWMGTATTPTGNWNIFADSTYQNAIVGNIMFGSTTAPTSKVHLGGNETKAAPTTTGAWFGVSAATLTDNSTAASGTVATGTFSAFAQPTYAASNVSVTVTDAATVYIANAPTAGTNVTITKPYSLWVDAGKSRFDGIVDIRDNSPQLIGTTAIGYDTVIYQSGTGGGGQNVFKRADGTEAVPTDLLSGMSLGSFSFRGYVNGGFSGSKAYVTAVAEANWSATSNPTRLVFSTTKTGSTTLSDRFTIDNAGLVGINVTPTVYLDVKPVNYTSPSVFSYDGATFTDNTSAAATSRGATFTVLSDTNDYFYVGSTETFTNLNFDFFTLGVNITLVKEYSKGGGTWGTLAVTDGTSNMTADGNITWTAPADWATDTVNAVASKYWIRLSTSSNATTIPLAYVASAVSANALQVKSQTGDSSTLTVTRRGTILLGQGAGEASSSNFLSCSATLIDTAGGAQIGSNYQFTLTPTGTSATDFRSLNLENTMTGAQNFTGAGSVVQGSFNINRYNATGNASLLIGVFGAGFWQGGGQSNFGTVTDAIAIRAQSANQFSSAATGTITTATGIQIQSPGHTATTGMTMTTTIGLDVQNQGVSTAPLSTSTYGVRIQAQSNSTNNTNLVIGTAATGTWNIYSNSTNVSWFGGKIGIGATAFTPTNMLSLSGQVAQTIWSERHATADTAGNTLTLQAGGATSGATDKNGGDLILAPGLSTGTGVAQVRVQGTTKGTTGTADNTLVNRIIVNGTVNLTSGVASTVATVTAAKFQGSGGHILYSVFATDGTDIIEASGQVAFSVVRDTTGAYINTTSVLGTEAQAKSDGTDTITNTWGTAATNTVQITSTITGMTPTTFQIIYTVVSNSRQAVTAP